MRLECFSLRQCKLPRARSVLFQRFNDDTAEWDTTYCLEHEEASAAGNLSSDTDSDAEHGFAAEYATGGLIYEPQSREDHSLESWLAELYVNPQHCFVIYVSPDRREAVFLARQYTSDRRIISGAHVLVGLRLVQFSDQQLLISWCNRPGCQCSISGRQLSLERAALFERLDYPSHHSSTANADSSEGLCCTCGTAVVTAVGGNSGFLALLQNASDTASPVVPVLRPIELYGKPGYAVNAQTSFEAWGIVLKEPSGSWRCRTCPRNTTCCRHVKVLQAEGDAEPAAAGCPALKLDQKLQQQLADDGKWKIQCMSRHSLPWDVSDDPHLYSIYTERNAGNKEVPCICTPDLTQPCSECNSVAWGEPSLPEGAPHCVVFYKGAYGSTQFAVASCSTPGCSGKAVVDGYEYGLLRQTEKFAFCLTLLYSWRHQLVPAPRPWYTFWRSTLQDYRNANQQQLRAWMLRGKQFEQATKDFINLMDLDWDEGFRCPHGLQGGVILDGITLGFKLSNAHFVKPWECGIQEDPIIWGSHFQERILVHDEKLRNRLAEYAELGSNAPGLKEDVYLEMLDKVKKLPVGCPEHYLEPFLGNPVPASHAGYVRAPAAWRSMLYTVGCPHPMSRYIKVCVFELVEKLVRGEQLPLSDLGVLLRRTPLLHEFLRTYLAAGPLPAEVRDLMSAMLKIAKQAVIPQHRRNTVPPVLQRVRQQQQQQGGPPDQGPLRMPESWGREEAFVRTGCFSAFHQGPWQPTALGGSDIVRPTRLYGADYQREAAAECEGCSKPGSQHAALLPGCLFYYCLCCRRCIGFHVMDNAESPKMPFVFFFTRCEVPPALVCYDNGCNEEQYTLAREPEFFGAVDFYVDASHWVTHTNCPPAYSSGSNPAIVCSPLAEQKNAFIGALRGMMATADQLTFLWFVRLYMYAMNRYEAEKAAGQCFYYKPYTKLKRCKRRHRK